MTVGGGNDNGAGMTVGGMTMGGESDSGGWE